MLGGMKPTGEILCRYEGIFVLYHIRSELDPYNVCKTSVEVVHNFLPYKKFRNECPFWKNARGQ